MKYEIEYIEKIAKIITDNQLSEIVLEDGEQAISIRKDNVVTNSNAIIGKEGIVIKEIDGKTGKVGQVKVLGDTWSAICEDSNIVIPVDSTVKVSKIDGVKLIVEPITIKSNS